MAGQISAIVPTFNRSSFLSETLNALLSQTRSLHQIIVWDDGSTDSTQDVVHTISSQHPGKIEYFRVQNGGKSRALNASMEHVTGDYVWICDDDDIALPDAAERLGAVLDSVDVGLVAGPHQRFSDTADTAERTLSDAGYWPDLSRGSVLRHTLEDIFFFQNATLVRRDAYRKVGPFREDLPRSIDYDMTVRLLARVPATMIEDPVFLQRKHDGARGPAHARHEAAKSEGVWLEADRMIFAQLRPVLPLSLYGAMFEGETEALTQRAALLQRATVYARRCDWTTALEDFRAALDLDAQTPLAGAEQAIAIRAMAGKHGAEQAFTKPIRGAVHDLASRGPAGKDLARFLSRGAVWRLREAIQTRQAHEAMQIAKLLTRTPPAPGQAALVQSDDRVRERRVLPETAYQW